MSSSSGSSKPRKGFRKLLKETLHVRSRSKSPLQPSNPAQPPGSIPEPPAGSLSNPAVSAKNVEEGSASEGVEGSASVDVPQPVKVPNAAWAAVRSSLQSLRDSSTEHWTDYDELPKNLTVLSDSLEQSIGASGPTHSTNAILGITLSIRQQAENLKSELTREARRDRPPVDNNEQQDSAVFYQRMLTQLRRLEINIHAGIWNEADADAVTALLEGLGPAKHSPYDSGVQTDIRRTCAEGTRIGVLGELTKWADDPTAASVCWMSGTTGIGKTTIASTFCEQLDNRKLLAASFFCSRTSAECKDLARIVPTIAYQLAKYSTPFRRALYESLSENSEAESDEMLGQFRQMIEMPLAKVPDAMLPNMVVVVDGLDECEDPNGPNVVVDILRRYAEKGQLKFLVTGRQKPEVHDGTTNRYRRFATINLDAVEHALVRADIMQYLGRELDFIAPTAHQLEELANRTGLLFICATMLVRFIRLEDPGSSHHDRLELILSLTYESTQKHAYIDHIYTAILGSVLNENNMEEDERRRMRVVLWTVLFAQELIGVETIGMLAGIEDSQHVKLALRPLQPMLQYSEEGGLVSPLHASFPEFMLKHERSGAFFYDIAQHSALIAKQCFTIMKTGLRFNICGLESSFVPDQEVEGLQNRVKERISHTLGYVCRHWASHLELAAMSDSLRDALEEFLSHRLLFWMEVLNLMREIRVGARALIRARQWLKLSSSVPSELIVFLRDVYAFVSHYAINSISKSTPHIYISALPFCPPSSRVYHAYAKRTTGLLEMPEKMMEHRRTAALAIWKTTANVSSITYSPDGSLIAFGLVDGTIAIRDAFDGTESIPPSTWPGGAGYNLVFSADGSKIASTGLYDGLFQIWNTGDGSLFAGPFKIPTPTDWFDSIAFSPDGTLTATGSIDGYIFIWNLKDGMLSTGPLVGHTGGVRSVAFSPDGTHLASASNDRTVRLWDIRVDPPSFLVLRGHTENVMSLAFSLDGAHLISCSLDRTVRVWDLYSETSKLIPIPKHADFVPVLQNGSHIAVILDDRRRQVWEINDEDLVPGPFVANTHWHFKNVGEDLIISPDGAQAISYLGNTIRVCSLHNDDFTLAETEHDVLDATSIGLSPSEARIYATGTRGANIWDISQGSIAATIALGKLDSRYSQPISPDGSYIAVFLDNHSVEVLATKDGSLIAGPFRGHTDSITSATFSSTGAFLATGSKDRTVRVWDMTHGRLAVGPLVGHDDTVTLIAFSSDDSRIVSYSEDGNIRIWNINDTVIEAVVSDSSSVSSDDSCQVLQGCTIRDDGWLMNSDSSLLFWFPLDFPAKPAPHTEICITRHYGSLYLSRQKLLLGRKWHECWIIE